jgi:hypothetical protein
MAGSAPIAFRIAQGAQRHEIGHAERVTLHQGVMAERGSATSAPATRSRSRISATQLSTRCQLLKTARDRIVRNG